MSVNYNLYRVGWSVKTISINGRIFILTFFLSPLEYSIDHDFSFLDPNFGNSAYQIFFPFLNLEQSKEADIKSFPELISRNLIL